MAAKQYNLFRYFISRRMKNNAIPMVDICSVTGLGSSEIMVRRFSEYLGEHTNLCHLHRHTFYHLLFFTRGAGTHTIDFEHFPVHRNQIYFMVPGQVHAWQFDDAPEGFIVNFSPSFFESFLLRPDYLETFPFFDGVARIIDLPPSAGVEGQLEELLNHSPGRPDVLRVLLLRLFQTVETYVKPVPRLPVGHYNYLILKNLRKLIDQHFLTLHRPSEYARMLYITPNHLNALCKEHLGLQAGELIRSRIALEAKRLLINFGMSISEIAYALHFNDNSYFTKFFKKQTGLTPEEFRKQHQ